MGIHVWECKSRPLITQDKRKNYNNLFVNKMEKSL
jgi:hypothetical protein